MADIVRTRFAPSPTGEDLHVGNAYTILLNYAFARKNNGKFIIRIEDTDQKRKVAGSEERIFASIKWLGLNYDEGPDIGGHYGPYRQSERLEIYKKYAEELVSQGAAYYCSCSSERLEKMRQEQQLKGKPPLYDGKCRNLKLENKKSCVIRLKMPKEGETVFNDALRGEISFKNELIDDQVLLKSDGFPTYHLAVVIDDHLMKITHVIRAGEWIPSTPKLIQLYKSFGWKLPIFAHTPMLLNTDKSKLSKRKNPVWVNWYREQGFLPEALINYFGLLGFSMPDEREKFSLEEFVREFDLKRISTAASIFDIKKLEWLNGEYIREKSKDQFIELILKFLPEEKIKNNNITVDKLSKIAPLVQERVKKLGEVWDYLVFFFEKPENYGTDILPYKGWFKETVKAYQKLDQWDHTVLYNITKELVGKRKEKPKDLFMSLRVAITGKKIGPPLFESMEILGKETCLKRLQYASCEI